MLPRLRVALVSAALAVPPFASEAASPDAEAAEKLARKSGCLKCHAVDKKKDAPSYRDIAAGFKGKPDAPQKLYTFLTTSPKVKVDGKEEAHDGLKTKEEAAIRNVVDWILTR